MIMILIHHQKKQFSSLKETSEKNLRIAWWGALWFHLYCYGMLKYFYGDCSLYRDFSFYLLMHNIVFTLGDFGNFVGDKIPGPFSSTLCCQNIYCKESL